MSGKRTSVTAYCASCARLKIVPLALLAVSIFGISGAAWGLFSIARPVPPNGPAAPGGTPAPAVVVVPPVPPPSSGSAPPIPGNVVDRVERLERQADAHAGVFTEETRGFRSYLTELLTYEKERGHLLTFGALGFVGIVLTGLVWHVNNLVATAMTQAKNAADEAVKQAGERIVDAKKNWEEDLKLAITTKLLTRAERSAVEQVRDGLKESLFIETIVQLMGILTRVQLLIDERCLQSRGVHPSMLQAEDVVDLRYSVERLIERYTPDLHARKMSFRRIEALMLTARGIQEMIGTRPTGAIHTFEAASHIDRDLPDPHFLTALSYVWLARYLGDGSFDSQTEIARTLTILDRLEPDELERHPEVPYMQVLRCLVEAGMRDKEAAQCAPAESEKIADLRKQAQERRQLALKISRDVRAFTGSSHPQIECRMGFVQWALGNPRESMQGSQDALKLDPTYIRATNALLNDATHRRVNPDDLSLEHAEMFFGPDRARAEVQKLARQLERHPAYEASVVIVSTVLETYWVLGDDQQALPVARHYQDITDARHHLWEKVENFLETKASFGRI